MGCNVSEDKDVDETEGNTDEHKETDSTDSNSNNGNVEEDEIYQWLGKIGYRQYYNQFKAKDITLNKMRSNMITTENLKEMNIKTDDMEQIMEQVHLLLPNPTDDYDFETNVYPNNEEGIKLFLNDLKLTDKDVIIKQFMRHGINDLETLYELTDEALKNEILIKAWGDRKKIIKKK
eukprot:13427_1